MEPLNLSESFWLTLLDNVSDGVYFVTPKRQILYWNKAAEEITGFSADDVVGRYCFNNILNHVDERGFNLCHTGCPLQATIEDGQARQIEVFLHHKNGFRVPVIVKARPIYNAQGEIIGAVETFSESSDLRAMRQKAQELEQAVMMDALTGIGSRRYIERNLQIAILNHTRFGIPFGLALIDVDHFKRINDTFGHDIGDQILRIVAQTLHKNLRSADAIARWGGDEFLAIITNIEQRDLRAVVEKLRILVEESRLRLPDKKSIGVTISIGATTATVQDTPESILKRADQFLYLSKSQGRNHITIG